MAEKSSTQKINIPKMVWPKGEIKKREAKALAEQKKEEKAKAEEELKAQKAKEKAEKQKELEAAKKLAKKEAEKAKRKAQAEAKKEKEKAKKAAKAEEKKALKKEPKPTKMVHHVDNQPAKSSAPAIVEKTPCNKTPFLPFKNFVAALLVILFSYTAVMTLFSDGTYFPFAGLIDPLVDFPNSYFEPVKNFISVIGSSSILTLCTHPAVTAILNFAITVALLVISIKAVVRYSKSLANPEKGLCVKPIIKLMVVSLVPMIYTLFTSSVNELFGTLYANKEFYIICLLSLLLVTVYKSLGANKIAKRQKAMSFMLIFVSLFTLTVGVCAGLSSEGLLPLVLESVEGIMSASGNLIMTIIKLAFSTLVGVLSLVLGGVIINRSKKTICKGKVKGVVCAATILFLLGVLNLGLCVAGYDFIESLLDTTAPFSFSFDFNMSVAPITYFVVTLLTFIFALVRGKEVKE